MPSLVRLMGAAVLAMVHTPAAGQVSQLVLELGGSQVRPPLGIEGSPANFMVGGLRGSLGMGIDSQLTGSVLAGRSLDAAASGDFLSGEFGAGLWSNFHGRWSAGSDIRLFAFDVGSPFPYRAGGIEAATGLRFRAGGVATRVDAVTGWGRSEVELSRFTDGSVEVVVDDLWRYGGTAEVLLGEGPLAVGLTGGWHESAGGSYRSLGGRLVLVLGPAAGELRVDSWRTPLGKETTGGLALVIPLGGWIARGFAGRSEPDPLTLAQPGSGGGGLLVGRLIAGSAFEPRARGLYEVQDPAGAEYLVRFSVEHGDAGSVVLLGDFTLWEPVSMTRQGDRWVAIVSVPEGTYHFGFLVDGNWYLPEETQDAVPDEWGRLSATLVVDPDAAGSDGIPQTEGERR